jgi:hypothetical protein
MSAFHLKAARAKALSGTILVLAAAASYEAAVALRVIPMGKLPGEGPFGEEVVMLIALLALLSGLVVSLSGSSGQSASWRSIGLVVAAVLVVGSLVSFAPVGGVAELIVLLALISGLFASLSYASSRGAEWVSAEPLVAPAAAAFVVARFYSFDDYYLPTLRRMSDGGLVPGKWIVGLVVIALLAAVATKIRPRIGIAMTSFVLFMSALTAGAEGIGH